MNEVHLAHMLRNRSEKYGQREVFRYKSEEKYKSINWYSFKEQSEKVAQFLLSHQTEINDNIGIFSNNCPQWTISDLAILSCRATVVPFYSTSTTEQLKYIVEETEMKILFVGNEEQLNKALPLLDDDSGLKKIITFNCLSSKDRRIISCAEIMKSDTDQELLTVLNERLKTATKEDLATIIYTSGTTGEPKGVMLTHHNMMASMKIHEKRLKVTTDDVSLCFLPLSHIFERGWTFFLLYSGGTNVYNENPKEIINEIAVVKPTIMCVVPRFFEKAYDGIQKQIQKQNKIQQRIFNRALSIGLKYIEYQKDGLKAPYLLNIQHNLADQLVYKKIRKLFGGNIKYMPCSGAAITPELKRFFHALDIFINYGYGASETTATISCMRDDKYNFEYTGEIMPDIKVKLSPENMIMVKGDTIFKGYYKKPEQTKEVLKDGWYYTGDQGQLPGNNQLHMTERIKDIIKTSTGKYVSPQKVELVLSKNKLIEQTCVIGDNRQYITALIVPKHQQLVEWLHEKGEMVSDIKDALINQTAKEWFHDTLKAIQEELPCHEKVVQFALLEEPFSIENGLLTNSLKVRRKYVVQKYEELIESLY